MSMSLQRWYWKGNETRRLLPGNNSNSGTNILSLNLFMVTFHVQAASFLQPFISKRYYHEYMTSFQFWITMWSIFFSARARVKMAAKTPLPGMVLALVNVNVMDMRIQLSGHSVASVRTSKYFNTVTNAKEIILQL